MRRLEYNGNEIIFDDDKSKGVAGIAPGEPDTLADDIVKGYNLLHYISNEYWHNPEDAIGDIRYFVSTGKIRI